MVMNPFNISSGSTRAEVAHEVAVYAWNRKTRETDHRAVELLQAFGYRSFEDSYPDNLQVAGSPQDKAAYALIGKAMDCFKSGSRVPDDVLQNLQSYSRPKAPAGWA